MSEQHYIPTAEEIQANIQKTLAEAEAARAAARKDEREAAKLDAEIGLASEALRTQRASAAMAELALHEQERAQREVDARDFEHGTFRFNDSVSAESVRRIVGTIGMYSRLFPGGDITLIFNSPGGSVFDGMALFDFLQDMRAAGHHVTTKTQGMAASMAGILLQAGDTRVMGAEAYVLIHEISTLAYGKSSDIEDEVEFIKKIQKRVIDIFVKRSGGKLTARKVQQEWKRKDWWLSSKECLELGLVDEVA